MSESSSFSDHPPQPSPLLLDEHDDDDKSNDELLHNNNDLYTEVEEGTQQQHADDVHNNNNNGSELPGNNANTVTTNPRFLRPPDSVLFNPYNNNAAALPSSSTHSNGGQSVTRGMNRTFSPPQHQSQSQSQPYVHHQRMPPQRHPEEEIEFHNNDTNSSNYHHHHHHQPPPQYNNNGYGGGGNDNNSHRTEDDPIYRQQQQQPYQYQQQPLHRHHQQQQPPPPSSPYMQRRQQQQQHAPSYNNNTPNTNTTTTPVIVQNPRYNNRPHNNEGGLRNHHQQQHPSHSSLYSNNSYNNHPTYNDHHHESNNDDSYHSGTAANNNNNNGYNNNPTMNERHHHHPNPNGGAPFVEDGRGAGHNNYEVVDVDESNHSETQQQSSSRSIHTHNTTLTQKFRQQQQQHPSFLNTHTHTNPDITLENDDDDIMQHPITNRSNHSNANTSANNNSSNDVFHHNTADMRTNTNSPSNDQQQQQQQHEHHVNHQYLLPQDEASMSYNENTDADYNAVNESHTNNSNTDVVQLVVEDEEDDDDEDVVESSHNYDDFNFLPHGGNYSGDLSLGDSHASFMEGYDAHDPNVLFEMLQDAIPKQTADEGNGGGGGGNPPGGAGAGGNGGAGGVGSNPELLQQRRDQAEVVWERVRRWLWSHPNMDTRSAAADVRGTDDATCLHLICRLHNPPEDVVQAVVDAAVDTTHWIDSHGWLPLHHACANGASYEVMKLLVDAYPAGKVTQDQQNRTPLHFYATRNSENPQVMGANAELLSDTGAAELTDRSGMLPMHYACAYGTHPVVLKALSKVYPHSLRARENNGRTPMHLAMVNAARDESPNVIKFLLEHRYSRNTINARDRDGYLPLHLLAMGFKHFKRMNGKETNVSECLSMYLAAEPYAAADFLTAIQDLPDWLQDTAVVSKHVRNILNDKIVKRFPTSIMMLDGVLLIVLIVCFAITTRNHIDLRFDPTNTEDTTQTALLLVFCGAGYFLIRELVQFASLLSLGSLASWWMDPVNYLDISIIVLPFFFGLLMFDNEIDFDDDAFRSGVAFTQGILWVQFIVYLKSTLVDFAVFVGGVFYVVQRLVAFLIAVGVILLAFAQMFFFVYTETAMCEPSFGTSPFDEEHCQFPHCTFQHSLLKVYTMMMGEIGDESRYSTNLTAQILYVGYAFLVVILLSNVLIAIVTDSYEIIQNDRAAIVFWSNRLDFVAEMDAITYAIQSRLGYHKNSGMHHQKTASQRQQDTGVSYSNGGAGGAGTAGDIPDMASVNDMMEQADAPQQDPTFLKIDFEESNEYFREAWHQVMLLFDANLYDEIDWIETWVYNIFRIFSIFVVIPLWLAVGAISAGWLWPPQVRIWLFEQKETTISRAELERQKLGQLQSIQADLKSLKQEIMKEMASDRDEMIRMKAEVETVQGEVFADLQQVKELMDSLLIG